MYTYTIYHDRDCENPRVSRDTFGTLYIADKRYFSGDKGATDAPKDAIALPVYAYIHSGIALSTSPFSCPWDSGRVGTIWVSKADARKEFGRVYRKRALELLEAELKEFGMWIEGDCWGYEITDESGDVVDGCWGFLGRDYCEHEARDICAHMNG